MDTLYAHCAGLDVHKDTVVVCVRHFESGRFREEPVATFQTTTRALLSLGDYLWGHKVSHVAMESTGVYWQPIWNLLEGRFELLLANAAHIKQVPGRKTDVKDCQWIAELLQHGLIKGSFVPLMPQRELRDLTRMRTCLVEEKARVCNRIQKVLEGANIKLGSVASDVLGASGRDMIEALIAGDKDPAAMADLARRRLRAKIPALTEALTGRVTAHHRFMLRFLMDQIGGIEEHLATLEARIDEVLSPFEKDLAKRLDTIPGFDHQAAVSLIAEIGSDMGRFGDAGHLCSWAGMCPGNRQSAGKRKSGRCPDANRWLRSLLCQTAWAAGHTKATYFTAQYHRLAQRRGKKRATMAVGHSQLEIAYHVIRDGGVYKDLGPQHFDTLHAERQADHLVKHLERLGYQVTLQKPAA
jgi:transposase